MAKLIHKSTMIKRVFAELRYVSDNDVSSIELLKLAVFIVKTYRQELNYTDEHGKTSDRQSFFQLDCYSAMNDGGWNVLDFETKIGKDFDLYDIDQELNLRRKIVKYLGEEWRTNIRTG